MAEPGLSLGYADLQRYVGRFLGLNRTISSWSTNESNEVDDIIQAGYRRFLTPETRDGDSYEWSFLRPTTTFTAFTTITGTTSGAPSYDGSSESTVTATTSKFYSEMVGVNFTFDTSDTDYEITEYVSATQVKVSGDASGEASGDTFTITATGTYAMPDNFGGVIEDIRFDSDNNYSGLTERPEGDILRMRSTGSGDGIPCVYAVRPKSSTGETGQRYELLVWPTPSSTYTLTIKYITLRDKLSSTYPYPLGSAVHAETILSAVMAEAEMEKFGEPGPHEIRFMKRLAASVAADKLIKPKKFGYNGDGSDGYQNARKWTTTPVAFNGTYY